MTAVIKKHQGEAVFHRAFDCVQNPYQTIEKLIEIGIDRVLTSRGKEKAMDGIELLAALRKMYGDKIELLAGSGINAENVKELTEAWILWRFIFPIRKGNRSGAMYLYLMPC